VAEGSEYCIDEAGKITSIGAIISDEGEARARDRIGCHAFGCVRAAPWPIPPIPPVTAATLGVEAGSGITIAPCGMRSRAANNIEA
jgi:hypothetical protein